MTIQTKTGRVEIRCYYDDQDPGNKGWYAHFTVLVGGEVVATDDTMKVWSVEMPRRRDAGKLAARRARGYARRLLAEVRS